MAQQRQHRHDGNDPAVSRGHNNPSKSTPITTGTPKKRETYEAQARERHDANREPQHASNIWHEQTPRELDASDRKTTHRCSGSKPPQWQHIQRRQVVARL